MAAKRKMSFEQSEAVFRNLSKAQAAKRANDRARRAGREATAERERLEALKPAAPRPVLVGELVTGRSAFEQYVTHTGTVVEVLDSFILVNVPGDPETRALDNRFVEHVPQTEARR